MVPPGSAPTNDCFGAIDQNVENFIFERLKIFVGKARDRLKGVRALPDAGAKQASPRAGAMHDGVWRKIAQQLTYLTRHPGL